MLNQRIPILEATLPLLQVMPDNSWHIIFSIQPTGPESYQCQCIRSTDTKPEEFTSTIEEQPFHVAEGIWELSYSVQLMTLRHESLRQHPATQLWQQWTSEQC